MKKILQCGLFTLMVSGFMNAHAADLNRLGSSSSSSSSSIIVTGPNASSSSSQSTALSPEMAEELNNFGSTVAEWVVYLNTPNCPPEKVKRLAKFFRKMRNSPQEQVTHFVNEERAALKKDDSSCYEYYEDALRGVKLKESVAKIPLNIRKKEDVRSLVNAVNAINWIPSVIDARDTMIANNALDDESLSILLDFVSLMCERGKYTRTWTSFNRALSIMSQETHSDIRKIFPTYDLIDVLVHVSAARPAKVCFDGWCSIGLRIVTGPYVHKDTCLFRGCQFLFWGVGASTKVADVFVDDAKLLHTILSEAGALHESNVDFLGDFFPPILVGRDFDRVRIIGCIISDPLIDGLNGCKRINELEIGCIWGDVDKLIGGVKEQNIGGVIFQIFKENFSLLQWISVNKPELLKRVDVNLQGLRDSQLINTYSERSAMLNLPGIEDKPRRCCIQADMWYMIPYIGELGTRLLEDGFKEIYYDTLPNGTFDALIGLAPYLFTMEKLEVACLTLQQKDAPQIALKTILDYCHNMREITSVGRVLESSPDVWDPYRVILHPFMRSESKDDDSFVRDELNKLRYADEVGINLNKLAEEKKGWYQVSEGDPLNNCIALLKGIISNERGSREKIATIMKVLSALKIDNVSLRLLSEKFAKLYAFSANDELPKLMQLAECIRRKCYVQPLQIDEMMGARALLVEWCKWFENERNTFYAIIARIKDVIARMIAVLPDGNERLIAQLKSIKVIDSMKEYNEKMLESLRKKPDSRIAKLKSIDVDKIFAPIMAQYRDCLILFQNVCYLTDNRIKEFSNDELQKILAAAQRKH